MEMVSLTFRLSLLESTNIIKAILKGMLTGQPNLDSPFSRHSAQVILDCVMLTIKLTVEVASTTSYLFLV